MELAPMITGKMTQAQVDARNASFEAAQRKRADARRAREAAREAAEAKAKAKTAGLLDADGRPNILALARLEAKQSGKKLGDVLKDIQRTDPKAYADWLDRQALAAQRPRRGP